MLKIGDKIKYVKENSFMEFPIGTVFEVTDIKGTALAVEGLYKVGVVPKGIIRGLMSYDEYEKYFEKVVEEVKTEPKKSPWTEWEEIKNVKMCEDVYGDCDVCPFLYMCDIPLADIEYKTNYKKIMIRYKMPNGEVVKAHSTCNKVDTFNLEVGLKVALARLNVKLAEENLQKNFKSFIETV